MFAVASPGASAPGAIGKVMRLTSAWNAELELFHCVYDAALIGPGGFTSGSNEAAIRTFVEQRRRQLERVVEGVGGQGVKIRASVRWDHPPHEGIVRQVLRHRPDLLIVQSTRRGRVGRLFPTYTDYKLIETCPCPVLLIKTSRPYTKICVIAAIDPLHSHDKAAQLDFSILESAREITRALSGTLHVYHGLTPWVDVARTRRELRAIPRILQEDAETAYHESVAVQVRKLARRYDIRDNRVHIMEGPVTQSLPDFARIQSADIVAMGAVSRSLFNRILIGHTAERLLDALDSDVLVIKPRDFRAPVSTRSLSVARSKRARRA